MGELLNANKEPVLRARRGKKSTTIDTNPILKKGEVFFEESDNNDTGKIKMGDGKLEYNNIEYFISTEDNKISFINSGEPTNDNIILLNNIIPNNKLKTIFTNLKQLLVNLTRQNNNKFVSQDINLNLNASNDSSLGYYGSESILKNNYKLISATVLSNNESYCNIDSDNNIHVYSKDNSCSIRLLYERNN